MSGTWPMSCPTPWTSCWRLPTRSTRRRPPSRRPPRRPPRPPTAHRPFRERRDDDTGGGRPAAVRERRRLRRVHHREQRHAHRRATDPDGRGHPARTARIEEGAPEEGGCQGSGRDVDRHEGPGRRDAGVVRGRGFDGHVTEAVRREDDAQGDEEDRQGDQADGRGGEEGGPRPACEEGRGLDATFQRSLTAPAAVSAVMRALYEGRRADAESAAAEAGTLDVFEAAALGRSDALDRTLADDPAAALAWSDDGFLALHYACFFGTPGCTAALVDAGAPLDEPSRNDMGVRPVNAAAAGPHPVAQRRPAPRPGCRRRRAAGERPHRPRRGARTGPARAGRPSRTSRRDLERGRVRPAGRRRSPRDRAIAGPAARGVRPATGGPGARRPLPGAASDAANRSACACCS